MDAEKQRKIIKTAMIFIQENEKHQKNQPRFDVVEVYLDDKKIKHLENAFDVGGVFEKYETF